VPDTTDLLAAGDAIRLLRDRDGDHPEHARRNFWNDVVIAVSCRRRGRVLVSRDRDHARIAAVVKHQVLTALPA
jgi:predicted nucleic acid-binding protein